MLWQKSKAVSARPSELIGLPSDSYEAYCLDEAVIYFGMSLEADLEQAGHKPSKQEKRAEAMRKARLDQVFGTKESGSGFADPALMFK